MRPIEVWFDFGSPYSHLSVHRLAEEHPSNGVNVIWRPFLLGPIFRSFGRDTSPFALQSAKGDYLWCDMDRQCRKYGITWRRPTVFPRRALLPTRVALMFATRPWMPSFCREIMRLNFGCDREVDRTEVVAAALCKVGAPAPEVIAAAQSERNKIALRDQTELARARGIFGAPTFFAGDAMFWGNDRLDDAIACAKHGIEA